MTQRSINFRAWDPANKRWFSAPSQIDSHIGDFMMTADGRVYIDGIYQDLILCQFTGLYDKNGTPIFEGDILKINASDDEFYDHIVFKKGGFALSRWSRPVAHIYPALTECLDDALVAGNLYTNPELLTHD